MTQPNKDNLLYTAREFDFDTGLQFNRMRYYNPNLGRFNKKDPILVKNIYSYVNNKLIRFFDPFGLYTSPIPDKVYIVYNDLTHGPPIINYPDRTVTIAPVVVIGACAAIIFLTSCGSDGDGADGNGYYYEVPGSGQKISCSSPANCKSADSFCMDCCQWCNLNANWGSPEYKAYNEKCLE